MTPRLRLPFLALVLAVRAARADGPAEPWLDAPLASPPAAALAAAQALRVAGDPSVQLLLDEARYTFLPDGRRTATHRQVFRLLKAEAVEEEGTIEAVWKPWKDEAPILRARVIRRDGTVHVLDPATIADRPAESDADVFDDRRVRSAPLPGLEEGALVERETVETEKTAFPGGALERFTFGAGGAMRRARVVVEQPAGLALRLVVRGTPAPAVVEETLPSGLRRRTWDLVDLPGTESWEAGAPPEIAQLPELELSSGRSWADVAALYAGIVDEKLKGAEPGAAGRASGIAGLLSYVRKQVRYASIDFGDSAIVPGKPADVLARRYGDCKDQATLLVGLLRARGIDASVVLLRAGRFRDVDPELPALGAFNHVIVRIEGTPPVYVDPTSPYHRAGELPGMDEGRWGLVCRKGVTSLERLPEGSALSHVDATETEVRLAPFGKGSIREVILPSGRFEAEYRSAWDGVTEANRRKSFERAVENGYGKGVLRSYDVPPTRDLSQPFRVTIEAERVGIAVTDDANAVFALNRGSILSRLPRPGEKKRRLDLATEPFVERVTYRVRPPAGYELESAPEDETRSLGPASLVTHAAREPDGSVTLTVSVSLDRHRISPDEALVLHTETQRLRKESDLQVVFRSRVEAAVTKGLYKEALAELAAAGKAAPSSADVPRRRSAVLLRAGAGEAARAEARAATRLEPKSARAWHQLGLALQHDTFGRLRQGVWDLAGADEALARAAELDPDDLAIAADRALLLEHDANGQRYRDPGRLARAADVYRAQLKKNERNAYLLRSLLVDLLFLGRAEEALQVLSDDELARALGEHHAVATALSAGAARAIAETRRRFPDDARRRELLETAGGMLVLLRRYELASPLLREAAIGSPRSAALVARADFLARVKRHEPLPDGPLADAREVAVALVDALASEPKDGQRRLASLWASTIRPHLEPDELSLVTGAVRRGLRTQGVSPEVGVDVVASCTDLRVEGDAATGYKVRADVLIPGAPPQTSVYWLDTEDGRPVLVGVEGDSRSFALHARALARRGDLVAARRWLDRIADVYRRLGVRGGEEPLAGPLFPELWSTPSDTADLRTIELACASALLGRPLDATSLAAVEVASKAEPWSSVKTAVHLQALLDLKRFADALAVARDASTHEPDRRYWLDGRALALTRLERAAEAEPELRAWIARKPGDAAARRVLTDVLAKQGKLEETLAILEGLLKSPDALPLDGNNAAWHRMILGKADDEAVALARRAVEWYERRDTMHLNTLAAVLAEAGRGAEAFPLVVESMDVQGRDEPNSADWYVVGRVFEGYGLLDEARAAYLKVDPEKTDPVSPGTLAGRRLAGLPAPAKKAPQRRS